MLMTQEYTSPTKTLFQSSTNTTHKKLTKWKTKINESETPAILFTRRKASRFLPKKQMKIANKEIELQTQVKYLGMILGKHITFRHHCKYLYSHIVSTHKPHIQIKHAKQTTYCQMHFLSMLLYAGEVWEKCPEA